MGKRANHGAENEGGEFAANALQNGLGDVLLRYSTEPPPSRRTATDPEAWAPPIDLVSSQGGFTISADLPGLEEEDVTVVATKWCVRFWGERSFPYDETQHNGFYRLERSFGRFACTVHLPKSVDPETLSRHYGGGVLRIDVKRPKRRSPRRKA